MNSGFRRATTALATLEEKLRRALGLAGEIGASFDPQMTPVLIAGDLREPGNSGGFAGRAFACCPLATPTAVLQYLSVQVQNDVFIDGISWGGACLTNGSGLVYVTSPAEVPARLTTPINTGTWIDRKMVAVDLVPLVRPTLWGALVGVAENDANLAATFVGTAAGATPVSYLPVRMMLPQGSALNFKAVAAGTSSITIHGRIWP